MTSGYGDIDLNELNGKIDINTGYGDINGKKITISKQISIKSGYGDIDCQIMNPISDCKVDLKTGYGKVKIKRTKFIKLLWNTIMNKKMISLHILNV